MIKPDLHAENPWAVALALAPFGLKLFTVHGMKARLAPSSAHGVELVCTCSRRAGEVCFANVPGKHPHRKGWQVSATDVEGVLRGRAGVLPLHNVGVVCGEPSRLVIIDVDGPNGLESLAQAERELGPLPGTVRSRSGREGVGFHIWLRLRDCGPIPKNKASSVLGPGIDVRGAGGFALIPGSRHKSGRRYGWLAAPDQVDFALIPETWLERLTAGQQPTATSGRARPNVRVFRRPHPATEGSRLIGDGPGMGGFHGPVYANACWLLGRHPDTSDELLIKTLRAAIEGAPKAPGRDVSRYVSDGYLREEVANARAYIEGRRP